MGVITAAFAVALLLQKVEEEKGRRGVVGGGGRGPKTARQTNRERNQGWLGKELVTRDV